MFGISLGSFAHLATKDESKPRVIPPPTAVRFPAVQPKAASSGDRSQLQSFSLVPYLQTVHRPADLELSHFEALKIHVISDASSSDIIPWSGFLPPIEEWNALAQDDLLDANEATRKPLSNGNRSPGVQTYRERQKELLTDNTAAFRTIRRIPPPAGEAAARLGNAYEFFKYLELFSGYWPDTSLSRDSGGGTSGQAGSGPDVSSTKSESIDTDASPSSASLPKHLQTHTPVGNGAQLPPDYRTHLLHAFTKLVAYDFGCNVSFARAEPRLQLTPSRSSQLFKSQHRHNTPSLSSYFNSSATFIYRIPTDRASARSGLVVGPVAALSSRASHTFSTASDEYLDFAREVVAVLLTAQQRSRKGKTEKRFGENEWWTTKPRWGGGPGGPIGRESDAQAEAEKTAAHNVDSGKGMASLVTDQAKRAIGGISVAPSATSASSAHPNKRSKKHTSSSAGGNMQIYENYRKMVPPGSSWDRKCLYEPIGRVDGADYDDIFLISSINHHVSIVRARIPDHLTEILEGAEEGEGWDGLEIWRSKWWDLYQAPERVEAMGVLWGMMAWLMRKVDDGEQQVKMDLN